MTVFITIKIYNLCKLFCVRRNRYACQNRGARPAGARTGALPSPIGLLPASENAKWCMLVSFALGLILSTAHIAGRRAVRAGISGGHGVWFRRRTVPRRLCAGLLCGVRRSDRHTARRRLLPDVSDGVFSAQPSVCADALVSAGRLRGGLHTDAAGAVPAHGGLSLLLVSRMALFLLLCAASAYGFDDLLRAQEPRTVNAEICRNVSTVFLRRACSWV